MGVEFKRNSIVSDNQSLLTQTKDGEDGGKSGTVLNGFWG